MDAAGGPSWEKWKRERAAAGLPILDVPKPKNVAPKAPSWVRKTDAAEGDKPGAPLELHFDSAKTGAAAVLP